jgi:hypothetical protein
MLETKGRAPRFGNVGDDGKSKPGAGTGRVKANAPSKCFCNALGRDSWAIIGDPDEDMIALSASRYPDA